MAIRKISILQNDGTWKEAMPIGAYCNDIILSGITNAGLAVGEDALSAKVSNTETGTSAWTKHNKLCDAVGSLNIKFDATVTSLSTTFDNKITTLSSVFDEKVTTLSNAFSTMTNSATGSLTNIVNAALPQTQELTIASDVWSNLNYTYTDNNFYHASGYVYWISPLGLNYDGVYAHSITDGTITFSCLTNPESYVTINIIRMQDGTPASPSNP